MSVLRLSLAVSGVVLVLILGALAWFRFQPVAVAKGWDYAVVQGNLERVTSLARMPDGSIVATLSPRQHLGGPGQGKLVQLEPATGSYRVLADGLFKPNGLLPYPGGVVITQEMANQPVLRWHDGKLEPLMMLVKPESIVGTAAGQWLVIEDTTGGRLLQVDPHTLQKTVLHEGFKAGEGVCVGRDRRIFVVDNKTSVLQEYRAGAMLTVLDGLHGPGFLRCTPDGIWITEDVTNTGRLLFYDYERVHVVAEHLHSPQAVLQDGNGWLLAEQGRSRLLRFSRQ
jgi:hypothetical protein